MMLHSSQDRLPRHQMAVVLLCVALFPGVRAQESAPGSDGQDMSQGGTEAEPGPALPAEAIGQRLDAYVQPFLDAGHLSGNLLVERAGETVYERSFGMASYELEVPNTPETRFNIASITKPMTVIILIKLAVDGKIALADPLSKYIPDFPRGDEITIEHLARHRSGIPHRVTDESEQAVPHTAAEMAAFAARKPLTFEPGSQSSYSSGGFSVLARALEVAGGASYGELLAKDVFEPTGMSHSLNPDGRKLIPHRASSYLLASDGSLMNAPLEDLSFLVGAGSVYSTARDLGRLLEAVRSGRLGEGPKQSSVDENGIDWNGVTDGYRAFADWHRDGDVTVVWTSNLHTGAGERLRRDVPRIVRGEDVPLPVLPDITPVAIPEETLRSYEGVYQLRPGNELTVRVVDGDLMVNSYVLIPTGPGTFFSPQDYATVTVVPGESGRPERLDWKMEQGEFPCPRLRDL